MDPRVDNDSAASYPWLHLVGATMKTFAAALLSVLFLSVEVLAAPPEADLAQVQTTTEALFTPGLDLAEVKLAIDRMVDPTVNRDAGLREIDRMANAVAAMAGDNADSAHKLEALKRYLYEAGSWNGDRPFNTIFPIRSGRTRRAASSSAIWKPDVAIASPCRSSSFWSESASG